MTRARMLARKLPLDYNIANTFYKFGYKAVTSKTILPCLNCGDGSLWCHHLSSLWEFFRAKSYCHMYGAQGRRQAYIQPLATMNFVGPDLTTADW
ncbi:hypothetical protein TNCV_3158571 [Trichonephila clavipes]|nr:hypothetical protein TNCV_3158571 [Trichonephila clavipes]